MILEPVGGRPQHLVGPVVFPGLKQVMAGFEVVFDVG